MEERYELKQRVGREIEEDEEGIMSMFADDGSEEEDEDGK